MVYLNNTYILPSEQWGEENSTKIDFKEIFTKYEGKLVEIKGVLNKVNAPEDSSDIKMVCPQCGRSKRKWLKVIHKDSNYYTYKDIHDMDICPFCSKYHTESDPLGFGTAVVYSKKKYNQLIQLIEGEKIYYTVQELEFTSPESERKLKVTYYTLTEAFTKKDIGKQYTITGKLYPHNHDGHIYTDKINPVIPDGTVETCVISDERDIPGYDEWRQHVLSRDKKCVVCGGDKNLHAHHLFGYKENPGLRTCKENGVTVCEWCHQKYHSYYGVHDINPVDFIRFVGRFGVR